MPDLYFFDGGSEVDELIQNGQNEDDKTNRASDHLQSFDTQKNDRLTVKGKADGKAVKRSTLGDLTNAAPKIRANGEKTKLILQSKFLPSVKTVSKTKQNENLAPPHAPAHKIQTRASLRSIIVPNQTVQMPKESTKEVSTTKVKTRLSNEFETTGESLYSSASEDLNITQSSDTKNANGTCVSSADKRSVTLVAHQMEKQLNLGNHEVPEGVIDFDKENWDDIFQISHYAMDIFNYLKSREAIFLPKDYMERQICLTRWMRSLLVDWMVEIQESFELNHETLYLGVKLVDLYLSKVAVGKRTLELVGAAAMFIASKYDDRMPPLVDDFLYICTGTYTRNELLKMEINLLKTIEFDIGIPLSYRFLRRYARCAKVAMPILTLARYILEYSLMDYDTVTVLDSKLASASLYLALKMKQISGWTPTLEFYTGYKLEDIISTVHLLNSGLHQKPNEQLMTVRDKYSDKIFFEVAKTPIIQISDLQES